MIELDDKKVFKLALELDNPRLEGEERQKVEALPTIQGNKYRCQRMLTGGPLSFMEAKILVREQLTHQLWKITFYEMVQFPHIRFFETEAEALKYFTDATIHGRGSRGGRLMPQRMELYGPAEALFSKRPALKQWKCASYTRDPFGGKYA